MDNAGASRRRIALIDVDDNRLFGALDDPARLAKFLRQEFRVRIFVLCERPRDAYGDYGIDTPRLGATGISKGMAVTRSEKKVDECARTRDFSDDRVGCLGSGFATPDELIADKSVVVVVAGASRPANRAEDEPFTLMLRQARIPITPAGVG
jgi:hypothetical protein